MRVQGHDRGPAGAGIAEKVVPASFSKELAFPSCPVQPGSRERSIVDKCVNVDIEGGVVRRIHLIHTVH